jgi:hypothetical protein
MTIVPILSPEKRHGLALSADRLSRTAERARRLYEPVDKHLGIALEAARDVGMDLRTAESPNMDAFVPTIEWRAAWIDHAEACRDRLWVCASKSLAEPDEAHGVLRAMDEHISEVLGIDGLKWATPPQGVPHAPGHTWNQR